MAWDTHEFAAVFNDLYPNVCRFLECMLGASGIAQEITQEAFLRLYSKGSASMPIGEARFWVFRVARNLALNELNKARTQTRLAADVHTALSQEARHPEQEYEHKERNRLVLELLEKLPEQMRATLILREQHDMSYQEIARVLNCSEGKVKIDIHRARMRLREEWNAIHESNAARKEELNEM